MQIAEVASHHDSTRLSGVVTWIGGKTNHLKWLLPMIPYSLTFVDVFGGSAAVLLARTPSNTDVYNDLDCRLVNFFRVLQNPEKRTKLLDKLDYTLYSREELRLALEIKDNPSDDVEAAWSFFVMTNQMFGDSIQHKIGSWGYGLNDSHSQPMRWQSRIRRLDKFIKRLKASYIESLDGIKCIKKYDTPTTVFYCDPPYVLSTRKDLVLYKHEVDDQYHIDLLRCLLECKGAVVLSGYHNPIYDDMLSKWQLNEKPTTSSLAGRIRGSKTYGVGNISKYAARIECVWRNARAMELCDDSLF